MTYLLIVAFLVLSASSIEGQKSLGELKPAHAAALKEFLVTNPDHEFLPESMIEADYLGSMRESFGRTFKPYYIAADLNRDHIGDFAVILRRAGKPIDQGKELAETHRFEYPMAIAIFNGRQNGKFARAFVENVQAPYVCYLSLTESRDKSLQFGIFETDAVYKLKPVRNGYVIGEIY